MPVMMALVLRQPWMLLPLVVVPHTWAMQRALTPGTTGVDCNAILIRTFRLGMWFALLLSAAAVLAHLAG